MPKAPAFQFYAQDFLTGVMDLTMDERGLYITLLARQWAIFDQKGIPKKRLALLVGFDWDNLPEMIKEKFDDNGDYFFNSRLMESFKQLKSYKEKQRLNGQKGGRPKTQTITKKRSSLKIEDRSMKNEDRKKKIEVEVKVEAVKPYQTENFDLAWNNWKEYKRLELGFNYKTIHSEQAALTQLGNKTTSEQHAIDSINNAMAKGWKGIYPEKELTNGSKKNSKNGQQYSEDFLQEVVTGLQSI